MTTNHMNEQLLALLCGELDNKQGRIARQHLAECDACKKEFETVSAFWHSLNLLPQVQPSDAIRERFYEMLQDAIEENEQSRQVRVRYNAKPSWFERLFPKPFAVQVGFALVLLAIGGVIGFQFRQPQQPIQKSNNTELTELHLEVLAMNKLLTVSLLQQQSASERLKGVSLSYRSEGSDPEITAALLQALKYDPNVNVRLAALDALVRNDGEQVIKKELLESLPKQSSPLVQIEIVDWLIQEREKTSLNILNRMLKNPEVNKAVKERIELGIQELNS